MLPCLVVAGMFALFVFSPPPAGPAWHTEVGCAQLLDEFGMVADGSGVSVALVEGSASGEFMPDVASAEFADKNIVQESPGDAAPSGHATGMAATFFGKTSSVAPGVCEVCCFSSSDWLGIRLGLGTQSDPQLLEFAVSNHSYIGSGLPDYAARRILQCMDYAVNQNGMTAVVGLNNGSNNEHPQLLSQAYNVISVGRTDGNHSRGETTFYGRGRPKPEIVAPASTTSAATAMVSSAAALIYDAADDSNATEPEVLKAILLAGATKSEFETWSRTITQPLDEAFGAGELNVYHSYNIFAGGESPGSPSEPTIAAPDQGWHYNEEATANAPTYYQVELPHGASELSVILCWNIDVIDHDPGEAFDPSTVFVDMDLKLYDSSHGFTKVLIDSSIGTEDNVEHIYQQSLPPGRYTLEVLSHSAHDYGLAWRVDPNPEP